MTDGIERGSRGPAPQWKLGRTRTIRVPIAIAEQLMEIARKIDSGEAEEGVILTKEDRQELSKSPWMANCPANDELAGQGLYKGKKVKDDRRQALEQQIQRWQTLREQLGNVE